MVSENSQYWPEVLKAKELIDAGLSPSPSLPSPSPFFPLFAFSFPCPYFLYFPLLLFPLLPSFPFFFYFGETNIPSRRCLRVCENFRPREHRRSGYRTSNHSSGLLCCCVLEPQYSFEGTRQSGYDRKLLLMRIPVFIRLFFSFFQRSFPIPSINSKISRSPCWCLTEG